MKRAFFLAYGVACYAVFFATFLYLIGFVGNLFVPRSVDVGPAAPPLAALVTNLGLILLFGVQHTVMARPAFKQRWTRIVPRPIERSTYVLITSVVLILLFWLWRPITAVIWDLELLVTIAIMWGVFFVGILTVLTSTFVIDHFDLFGLRQVWLSFRERPYTFPGFKVTWYYRFVRHPIYVGWMLFFWATPTMTAGHLLLAAGMTAYMLIAIVYEERDLVRFHGDDYLRYREKVPKLIPRLGSAHETVPEQRRDDPIPH